MMGYRGTMPSLLAEALGMTVEDLSAALNAGQTVAQIAEAQGVELADDMVDVLVAPRVEWLDQAVEVDTLTREQADQMLATMKEHMLENLTTGMTFGNGQGGNGNCPMHNGTQNSSGGMRGRGRGNHAMPQPQWNAPQS